MNHARLSRMKMLEKNVVYDNLFSFLCSITVKLVAQRCRLLRKTRF